MNRIGRNNDIRDACSTVDITDCLNGHRTSRHSEAILWWWEFKLSTHWQGSGGEQWRSHQKILTDLIRLSDYQIIRLSGYQVSTNWFSPSRSVDPGREGDGETVELVNIPRINISSISAHTDELAPYRELAHLCRLSHLTFHPVSISGWADASCRESHTRYLSRAVPVECGDNKSVIWRNLPTWQNVTFWAKLMMWSGV